MDFIFIKQLGVSVGLGLLVGFQREWDESHVAGIRSFALMALMGTICAHLADAHGGWIVSAGLIAITAMLIAGGVAKYCVQELSPGITTGAAVLLIYSIGALVVHNIPAGITVGGLTAVLLHWKHPLHAMVKRASQKDLRAIIQLVLIALVVLPLLPNRAYDPYDVLNPFKIWLMVVLIAGISLSGYIVSRLVKSTAGILISGVLGGVISSTATTASFAKHATAGSTVSSTLVILIASTVAFFRILFEIGVVAPAVFLQLLPQLIAMILVMMLVCAMFYLMHVKQRPDNISPTAGDPTNLKMALTFGLLYALILFAVAAAKEHFGDRGMYVIAGLSGLTDMDAITLSTTQLLKQAHIELSDGWRMILLGGLSNLVFKGAIAGFLGNRRLLMYLSVYFGLAIAGGVGIIVFG